VLEDGALVPHVAALADAARTGAAKAEALRASPSCAAVSRLLSKAPDRLGECGFLLFDPAGVVLCSDQPAAIGRPLAPGSAAVVRALALGEWTVSRPLADRQVGLELDPETPRPVMFVGGPIRGVDGQVLATGVFFFSPQPEFAGFLSSPGPVRLLAFDGKSLLLNNLKDHLSAEETAL